MNKLKPCCKQTLIEVLKLRPAYYRDKTEQFSLGEWTEEIVKLMKTGEEEKKT